MELFLQRALALHRIRDTLGAMLAYGLRRPVAGSKPERLTAIMGSHYERGYGLSAALVTGIVAY